MTMFRNRVYYFLKPIIPWHVRIAARRQLASRERVRHADVWPIDQRAGATPPSWPGWPEGKRFAFVLTHDVESSEGLRRVERLMQLDSQYGFRSSFNFVPEGDYRVSESMRQRLVRAGVEIGVHGLKHDGKLYSSKARFLSHAQRIKEYLHNWNASGFRSPLAQHKLGWLHYLGTEYDSSTFDTDPFEPQSDGVGTVFPFWVPGPEGGGYVELPYTLPQDFTAFVVLREQGINIWKRKLDWIAERGGMALLITHPDYICFEGQRAPDEFPVSYYEDFLRYARETYGDSFWHALPRDVSRFYSSSVPLGSRNSRKRICMVAYTAYESDNRVRRYAETLARRGDRVDVVALGGGRIPLGDEDLNGVTVHRIQRRDNSERYKWTYGLRLLRFCLASSVWLKRQHQKVRYDLIHVHNVPDFLVFAAWYPKWTGAKVILDIHDLLPELFASKFGTKLSGIYCRLLKTIEKASAAFADYVIVANHLWQQKLISRSVPAGKCKVFLNHVDPAIFYRRQRTRTDDRVIILFPGSFQWHQGLDIAIKALGHIKDEVPNAELHLYGGGGGAGTEEGLAELAGRLGLDGRVQFCGAVPLEQIADVIANADLGIVPKRANSFGNEAYSTKIMEFMSQGVPVVASRTKIDTFYFDDTVIRFFKSGDSEAMAEAMLDVLKNRVLRESLIGRGYEYVERNSWAQKSRDYCAVVDSLTAEMFESRQSAAETQR